MVCAAIKEAPARPLEPWDEDEMQTIDAKLVALLCTLVAMNTTRRSVFPPRAPPLQGMQGIL
eukprot:417407-Amphidinium_carterae.1